MSRHANGPMVHAFTRENGTKLPNEGNNRCASVFEGDATNENDIKAAIRQSRAKVIVICIGDSSSTTNIGKMKVTRRGSSDGNNPNNAAAKNSGRSSLGTPKNPDGTKDVRRTSDSIASTQKDPDTNTDTFTNVRTECAKAIVKVLTSLYNKKKIRIQVVVLSRIDDHKKNKKKQQQIEDHNKQEEIFISSKIKDRVSIIRPYRVMDSGKALTIQVRVFDNNDKEHPIGVPVSRTNLTNWITEEVCCKLLVGGTKKIIIGGK